jgi:predicted nuclease with TOPRIM domain
MIRFPVLHSLKISGYELFRGPSGAEIDRALPRGVTLVVGINGLGKTTLLNAIFRVLSGPVEWRSRRINESAGSTPTDLAAWKNLRYFRRRVSDDARTASIETTVAFGGETIKIRRSLRTLALTHLEVAGKPVTASEAAYRETVVRLANLQSFEDFFLILRYLTFFLEERHPIVWDASAQSDLLRVLFFSPQDVSKVRDLFDKIQRADSQRRNIRAIRNRMEEELRQGRLRAAAEPELEARASGLQTRLEALRGRYKELAETLDQLDTERRDARREVESTKLQIESLRSEYASVERIHLSHVFPDASEIARFVFLRRDQGCLVCGNQAEDSAAYLEASAEEHACPACRRPLERRAGVVSSGEVNEARMKDISARLDSALLSLRGREEGLQTYRDRHSEVVSEMRAISVEQEDLEHELASINAKLPPSSERLVQLSRDVHALGIEMRKWEKEQAIHEKGFGDLLKRGETAVAEFSAQVAERFSRFAGAFLAERCVLHYQPEERRIGVEGVKFPFPRFTARMTSATMPNETSPRPQATDVSESQREFIDLAFRMAVMDVAAGGEPTMLVVETPEASLDVMFVDRAGLLLGEFANAGNGTGNRLIASSNLTGGDMIPSLLGLIPSDDKQPVHHIPTAERPAHVLNLLDVAAESAAVRTDRESYEKHFRKAVYPEDILDVR